MSEPASTATGGALALGTVTVTGTILGMQADALLAGLIAALLVLMSQRPAEGEQRTPGRVFAFVATGAFAAGLAAPLLVLAASEQVALLARADGVLLRVAAGALIGASIHLLIPAAMSLVPDLVSRIRKMIGGGS